MEKTIASAARTLPPETMHAMDREIEQQQLIRELTNQVQEQQISKLRMVLAEGARMSALSALQEEGGKAGAGSSRSESARGSSDVVDVDGISYDCIKNLGYHNEVRMATPFRRCTQSPDQWLRITGSSLPIFYMEDVLPNIKGAAKNNAPTIGYETMFSTEAYTKDLLKRILVWEWADDKKVQLKDLCLTKGNEISEISELRMAMSNLQRTWKLAYGGIWEKSLQSFISRMDYDYPFRNYRLPYVVGAIEEILRQLGAVIRTAPPRVAGTPERPEYYVAMVEKAFVDITFDDKGYEDWAVDVILRKKQELPQRSLDRAFEEHLSAALGTDAGVVRGKGRDFEYAFPLTEICGHDLRAHYGLKGKDGVSYAQCMKSPCNRLHHHQLEGRSKSSVKKGLEKFHMDSDTLHRMIDADSKFHA